MDSIERTERPVRTRRSRNAQPAAESEIDNAGGKREADGVGEHDEAQEDREDDSGGAADAEHELDEVASASDEWNRIWKQFADNRSQKGSSFAWAKLQIDFALSAGKLGPFFPNGKDFAAMMGDLEQRIKNESGTEKADPMEAVASWLRGGSAEETIQ